MKKIVLPVFLLMLAASCSKDNSTTTTDCGTVAKSYATDVSPVIASSCATSGCHASGSSNGPGALTTYAQVYNARTSIRSSVANGSMPQGSTLSTTNKNAILCWIDQGAANN